MLSKIAQNLKEAFGKNHELVESTEIALEERLASPFYGYLITSWVFLNWKIIYVAFFVSQDNILKQTGLLRYDYLREIFPVLWSIQFWFHFVLYPLLITFCFFWVFPLITRIFLRKYLRNKIENKIIEAQESQRVSKVEKEKVKAEKELITAQLNKAKEVKKIEQETPEILWAKEFEEYKKSLFFRAMIQKIITSIYEYGGSIKNEYNDIVVDKDALAYADTHGLITMIGSDIKLTNKGKYFLRLYNSIKEK